ncbi:hypothetical protein STANM337S_02491 [Streptomyces tanashiensis]
MRTRFKVLAALSGGLSTLMVLTAALTLLPGRLPLPSSTILMSIAFATVFPLTVWTIVEGVRAGAERSEQWPAFLRLPGRVQLAVGLLIVTAAVTAYGNAVAGSSRQSPDVREGRYYAYETSPGRRGTVEVSRQEYAELTEIDQRGSLAIPGAMLAGMTALLLVSGEMARPAPLPR